jgi:hypothetical protein
MQMLQGRTCLTLYANVATGLVRISNMFCSCFSFQKKSLIFCVVDWRVEIGHACCPLGFLAT